MPLRELEKRCARAAAKAGKFLASAYAIIEPELAYFLELRDRLNAQGMHGGVDPDGCWLHEFRASGATRYFQVGMPLPDIMHLGGWRDVKSVQRYLGLLQDDRLNQAIETAWA